MPTWTDDELSRIGKADELQLASRQLGRTLRPYVTMWAVRAGDDLYVRSASGPDNPGAAPRPAAPAVSAPAP
jgi:hypothetical protein